MSKPREYIAELFAKAQEHHLARRFVDAEKFYIKILRENPKHADSTHLLGTMLAQAGQTAVPHRRHAS